MIGRFATQPDTLRVFDAVVTHGTETAAARLLGIGQPQVSRILARLQRELGVRLLLRQGRRLVVTEEGLALQVEARRALAVLDDLPAAVGALRGGGARRVLRILAQPHLGHGLLPRAAALLASERPRLRLSLDIRMRNTLLEWSERQPYDLALLVAWAGQEPREAVPLFRHELLVAMPRGHPLARRRGRLAPGLLAEEGFVALRPGQMGRRHLDWLHEAAGRPPRILLETTTALSALQLCAEGLGLAMTDPLTAAVLAHDRRLVTRGVQGAPALQCCALLGRGVRRDADVEAAILALRRAGKG